MAIGMRISVVIPVHNRQALGERALRSAMAQAIDGMEVVVVDDCSQTPFGLPADITGRADVRLIRHSENRGAAAARNTGVEAARAGWVAFLDSDDYWLADTLRPRLELSEQTLNADRHTLTVHAAGFLTHNVRTSRRDAMIPVESDSPVHFASGCWFAPGSTMLFRKELFGLVGAYDPTLRRLEDLDWFLRFALAGGRLKVWDHLSAVVETGRKPRLSTLEDSARHLQAKFGDPTSPHRLQSDLLRRLDAYLDLERDAWIQEVLEQFGITARDIPVLMSSCKPVVRNPTDAELAASGTNWRAEPRIREGNIPKPPTNLRITPKP
jgi:glycosyltransferase involved in cell wall biosynthesis